MKKVLIFLFLFFISINVFADSKRLHFFNTFPKDITNVKVIENDNNYGFEFRANDKMKSTKYVNFYIIGFNDINDFYKKRDNKEQRYFDISDIGSRLALKSFNNYKDNINDTNNKHLYDILMSKNQFNDGKNIFSFCAIKNLEESQYLYCMKPIELYYNKEERKIISKEEYEKIENEKKELERKKEDAILKRVEESFNKNKIKKSRYGMNTKITNFEGLKNYIIEEHEKGANGIAFAKKLYLYDDNYLAVSSAKDFQDAVLIIIKRYDEKIKEEELNKKMQKENYKEEALNNYGKLKKEYEAYKLKNENDRKKAIDFSKKLLKILSKIHSKDKKLEKIQELKEIINTKYSPDKFKNQGLINYVKDYLDIVEFSIQIN